MSTKIFNLSLCLIILFLISCTDEKRELCDIERIIISSKIVQLRSEIELEEDLIITDNESDGKYTFQNISRVVADDNGNIYVLDNGQLSIHVFDNSGQYLYSFGNKGEGPGEFHDMADFHINSAGMICVYDFSTSRISLMTKKGEFVDSKQPKRILYFMHSIDNEKYILLQEAFDKGKDKLELIQTKFDGSRDIIYQGNFHKLLTTIVNDTEQPLHYGSASICACSRQRIVAHSTGEKYIIEFFDLKGKKFREIVWQDFRPLKVTEQDKQRELNYFSNFPASFVKNIAFSKTKHVFKTFRFDDSGNLWAIREGQDKKLYADIFNIEGQYYSHVQLPNMLFHITDKFAYGFKLIESDFFVIRYKIIKQRMSTH